MAPLGYSFRDAFRPLIDAQQPPPEPPAPPDPVLTLAEAADVARVSKRTLYRAARAGSGPFYKVGAQWRVDASELRAWMRSREHRPAAKPNGVLGEVMELRAGTA